MKPVKIAVLAVAVACVCAGGLLLTPSLSRALDRPLHAQSLGPRELSMFAGHGGELGVRVSDSDSGVTIEEVQPDSAADRAGLKRGDVIVEFDGEHVRSGRQFARLVQETPAGRTVKAVVTREGRRQEFQVKPSEGRVSFPFNYSFELPGLTSSGRLGITINEMTGQLAQYFGTRNGVLVTAVADGSAAARAGIKAGDVITSINGAPVATRDDLMRGLHETTTNEVTIGLVRDRKEMTVKATVEAPRRTIRSARPV
jgi:serine protease Do